MKIQTDIECAITTEENVLISGGNPAARTALARLIHQRSSRRDRSWVVLESNRPIQPPSDADEARLEPDAGRRLLFIEELATLDGPAQDDLMRLLRGQRRPTHRRSRDAHHLSTAHNPVERLAARLFDTGLFYRLNTIHIALGDERRLPSPTTVH
jgi:DNA-binding NtrC family response regulator